MMSSVAGKICRFFLAHGFSLVIIIIHFPNAFSMCRSEGFEHSAAVRYFNDIAGLVMADAYAMSTVKNIQDAGYLMAGTRLRVIDTALQREKQRHRKMEENAYLLLSYADMAYKKRRYAEAGRNYYRLLKMFLHEPWLAEKMKVMSEVIEKAVSIPPGIYGPVHRAAMNGDNEVLKLLLEKKIDANILDNEGRTPLILALDAHNKQGVKLLLAHGADPNLKDREGRLPLFMAVKAGDYAAVRLLLVYGANPNIRDEEGCSLLMVAIATGNFRIAKLLLAYDVDPNVVDKQGLSALDLAYRKKAAGEDVLRMLISRGADIYLLRLAVKRALIPEAWHKAGELLVMISSEVYNLQGQAGEGMVILDDEIKENLIGLSRKLSVFFQGVKKDGSNISAVLQSATTAFNVVSQHYGSHAVMPMQELLSDLVDKYNKGYSLEIYYSSYDSYQAQAFDPHGNAIRNDRLSNATPFVFGEYDYLVMQDFAALPGVQEVLAKKILHDMVRREVRRLTRNAQSVPGRKTTGVRYR